MENSQDIERRLLDLEVKASFADDLLEQLNQIIVRQQQQIDRLQRELADLRQQQAPEGGAQWRSLRDELPPHY
ncbi:MAG: SlyX family protein [Achromobacter pulmonis]|nr:SlyX family protein [Achromobacter pulmonis]MCF7768632.1 SlyX family protein [Achromobacter pulmonis]MPT28233.1 SlyX family protein [Achromobacter sp.]